MHELLTNALTLHPAITGLRLVGSRSREEQGPLSDWDFVVENTDPAATVAALPDLLEPLGPLATLWDPLSEHWTLAVLLPGPVKIDLVVDAPHEFAPAWSADPARFGEIDAHFWDWAYWLGGKVLKGQTELVDRELAKMHDFLLRPLGVADRPRTVPAAVRSYLAVRSPDVSPALGTEIVSVLHENGVLPVLPELPSPGAYDARDLSELVVHELRQLAESGHDVSAYVGRALEGAEPGPLLDDLAGAPRVQAWAYDETAEPTPPALPVLRVDREALPDRILGAWRGRCAGCLLGKPVEGWTHEQIEWYLARAGLTDSFDDYLPRLDQLPAGLAYNTVGAQGTFAGEISGMARDDDIDYTILALLLAEQHGPEFTTEDVAALWLDTLPFHKTYTAERAAMRNLIEGYAPTDTATWRNPYREWIGALIRGDFWGYVNPGDPTRAAELVTKDARLSHVGNGILGAQWSAGLLAACLAVGSVHHALDFARALVPSTTRLGEALAYVDRWYSEGLSFEEALSRIRRRFGAYNPVHTIDNAAVIAAALRWGDGDFGRSITLCVRSGWDTDSNGATVGSAVGALLGAKALPSHWIEPLEDRVRSAVFGHAENRITDLAARTVRIADRIAGP